MNLRSSLSWAGLMATRPCCPYRPYKMHNIPSAVRQGKYTEIPPKIIFCLLRGNYHLCMYILQNIKINISVLWDTIYSNTCRCKCNKKDIAHWPQETYFISTMPITNSLYAHQGPWIPYSQNIWNFMMATIHCIIYRLTICLNIPERNRTAKTLLIFW
jgi:hypothetical protein